MSNHAHASAPEKKKSNWILVVLLAFFIVTSIAFFFYGLVRQFQADENMMAAHEAERQAITALSELQRQFITATNESNDLRAQLEECRKGKSSK